MRAEKKADSIFKTLISFFLKTIKSFFLSHNKQSQFITYLNEYFTLHNVIILPSTVTLIKIIHFLTQSLSFITD